MPRRFLFCLILALPALPVPVTAHASHATPAPTAASERDPTSPDEVFAQMHHTFRADRAKGLHLRYQFNFSDPQGGKWWLQIDDGAYTMGKGTINRPDVTFNCTGADWVRLSNGTLGGWEAFFSGRLHVSGSQLTAHKLDDIFP